MDQSPEVGTPNEKPRESGVPKGMRRLEQQLSAKDRIIAELRKQIDEQGNQLAARITALEGALNVMVNFVARRDDVIALQASLSELLLGIYRPEAVQYVQAQVQAAKARLEQQARQAAEEAAAQNAENRT